MLRLLPLTAALLALAAPARSGDAIAPEVVRAVKRATAYVRVEAADRDKSGSGFVAVADGGTVLVVTNHHVAVADAAGVTPAKPAAVTVVLDSGTAAERSYPAEVVAADAERDLAVLKLVGVRDAPKPVASADPRVPAETTAVYTFGFPFGQGISAGKGFPAVTVGKASVSSLRVGAGGELAAVQIDGNLNPGNSGGPAVDGAGRLVGVAVAARRDGQGIGFLVPAAEVARMMEGRLGRVRVAARKGAGGKPVVRVEADVIDPLGVLRGATAYYVLVPPKGKPPETAALDKHPGSQKLALRVEKGVAAAEFAIEAAAGEVVVQVVAERLPGGPPAATRPRGFPLSPGPGPEELAGPPPAGWADYVPTDKTFAVWLPAGPARQERQRSVSLNGQAARVSSVAGVTADGLAYRAESVALPPALAGLTPVRLHALVRAALLDEGRGRFTESVAAESGTLQGVQYRVEHGDEVARARVFLGRGGLVRLVRVAGTAEQVATPEAETILLSFRLPGDRRPAKGSGPPPAGGAGPPPADAADRAKGATILGSVRDPVFKTVGPAGGVLVGLEARFAKFGTHDIVRAVRPIYLVGGKEEFGKQFGGDLTGAVTLKAKEGYAVGGISAKAGLWCHGFALAYMKVKADGSLDPADAYESEWAGWAGAMPVTKVGGDGRPAVGIVGKIVRTETTALGLLFKGQEDSDPAGGQ